MQFYTMSRISIISCLLLSLVATALSSEKTTTPHGEENIPAECKPKPPKPGDNLEPCCDLSKAMKKENKKIESTIQFCIDMMKSEHLEEGLGHGGPPPHPAPPGSQSSSSSTPSGNHPPPTPMPSGNHPPPTPTPSGSQAPPTAENHPPTAANHPPTAANHPPTIPAEGRSEVNRPPHPMMMKMNPHIRECLEECIYNASGILTNEMKLNEKELAKFISDDFAEEETWKVVSLKVAKKCSELAPKKVKEGAKCKSGALQFSECALRELYKECPENHHSKSEACKAEKAMMEKCPNYMPMNLQMQLE